MGYPPDDQGHISNCFNRDAEKAFPRGLKPRNFAQLTARKAVRAKAQTYQPRPFKTQFVFRACQAVLVAAVVCFSLGATDSTARFNALGGKLMCTCGCAQSLMGCDHVGCPNRGGEMDQLRSGIASGQSDQLILDGFVERWGTTVLAAPTMKGFDLVAWIMPFAVAGLALLGTIFLVRHWTSQQPKLAPAKPVSPARARAEEEMRERIRRETGIE
jgi:cytochrome c-type biogenesis protein CcmH/NrfF